MLRCDGRCRLHHARTRPSAPRSEPLLIVARALEAEAPYFVDYVSQELQEKYTARGRRRCLHDARRAPAADRAGCAARRADAGRRDRSRAQAPARAGRADRRRSAHRRNPGVRRRPLVQPVAVQPRRQREAPAGLGVQAVRLSRRVRARASPKAAPTSRRPRSSATSRPRSRSTHRPGARTTTTANTTARSRCAARSRCRATSPPSKSPRAAGYDEVAALWRRVGAGTPPRPYPSIALGVFEATPFEIATAYTIFPNGGIIRPLRTISRLVARRAATCRSQTQPRRAPSRDPTRPFWSRT